MAVAITIIHTPWSVVVTGLPVDVYVPGCPPAAEALIYGLLQLQKRFGALRPSRGADSGVKPVY